MSPLFNTPSMCQNTLFILGNGFDISHGIKSRYSDFKQWISAQGDQRLIGLMDIFFSNRRNLWSDIEKALGEYDEEALPDTALRLGLYINKVEYLRGYLAMLTACTTAKEIAEVVAIMAEKEPRLTRDEIDKARFISLLPSLAPQVTKGVTTDNLRIHIDNAMQARKKKDPSKSILR